MVKPKSGASGAVESGVAWKTVSGARSSKAEVDPSNVLKAGRARGRTKISGTVSKNRKQRRREQ